MQYAVIRIKGTQYKVQEKDEILVDKVAEKDEITPEVLLIVDEKGAKIGDPTVKGAKVTLKRLSEEKGEKIHVVKYKSKSRYRKHIGSRAKFTKFEVTNIS